MYIRSPTSPLSLYLLCKLILEMKHPQMQPSLSLRRNCTHRSDLSQHHDCVLILFGADIFFKNILWWHPQIYIIDLSSLYPQESSQLVMRRLESKHSAVLKHACTRCRHIFMRSTYLSCTTGSTAEDHALCLYYRNPCERSGKTFIPSH